jgi:putative transcriptional regulator
VSVTDWKNDFELLQKRLCPEMREPDSCFVPEFEELSSDIAGSLLIAHPNLLDPNFRRSVLYIQTHTLEEGAFGMILNRPTGKTAVDLLPDLDFSALGRVPVFLGGPVSLDRLMFASFKWDAGKNSITCSIHLSVEEANLLVLSADSEVRAFVGYAGWSPRQLEGELQQKAWIVRESSREVLDVGACETMWRKFVAGLGPYFKLLAAAPDDPSLN